MTFFRNIFNEIFLNLPVKLGLTHLLELRESPYTVVTAILLEIVARSKLISFHSHGFIVSLFPDDISLDEIECSSSGELDSNNENEWQHMTSMQLNGQHFFVYHAS